MNNQSIQEQSIAVSVIVAVFNREDTLDRCLDSLVHQTLENIEIILVDDQSTDRSMDVMQRWQNEFPNKIRIFQNPDKGVANTKNMGIINARGEYLAFVDSDDYVDYRMFTKLYDLAVKTDTDLVCSPIWRVFDNVKSKFAALPKYEEIPPVVEFLKLSAFFLVGKLFRRELFDRFGLIPQLHIGEDVSLVFPIMSHMKRIAYHPDAFYFYELSPNSVSINKTDFQLVDDIIEGSKLIMQNVNPVYRPYAITYAARRLYNLGMQRVGYYDMFMDALLDFEPHLLGCELAQHTCKDLINKCQELHLTEKRLPKRVYVNGFGLQEVDTEPYTGVFYPQAEVVVLNQNNCDINCLPVIAEAFKQGRMDFVGKYFAAKKCYEEGGVYVDASVEIDIPFNSLVYSPGFLGFETENTLTDCVFGANAGNQLFREVLATYEMDNLYDDAFTSLSSRFKTVAIGTSITTFQSHQETPANGLIWLYPVEMFIATLPHTNTMHLSHIRPECFAEDNRIEVPANIYEALVLRNERILNNKAQKIQRDYNQMKVTADKNLQQAKKAEKTANARMVLLDHLADEMASLRKIKKKVKNDDETIMVRIKHFLHRICPAPYEKARDAYRKIFPKKA